MDDPSNICLDSDGGGVQKRRDVYAMMHLSNVIRKNILLIAPGIDAKGFSDFVKGPNEKTRNAMIVAISQLPKTITKTVVSSLGMFRVEDKNNVNYSRKFEKIFRGNGYMEMYAADFFTKNLTTARCNGIVFIMQPYLVFRYDLKHRDSWFDRCRFIWIGCAIFRLPSLLPVIAAQIVMYTIKLFIQQPTLTRKEELSILSELLNFLPGLASVAKPSFGVGLSVYYRDMARHRRIVLEAIVHEATNRGDLQYYNAPYSMMSFESMDDVISFVEEELKDCDKQETMEKNGRKKNNTGKDPFGDDSDLDEEDRELLQLGGYRVERDEDMGEEQIVEEVVEEEIVEYEEIMEDDMHDDEEEEHSETSIRIFQNCGENMSNGYTPSGDEMERDGSVVGDCVPVVYPCHHIEPLKKIRERDRPIVSGRKRRIDTAYEMDDNEEISPLKRCRIIEDGIMLEEDDKEDEAKNEDAIREIFHSIPAVSDNCSGWDPSMVLSTQEISRGFLEESTLLTGVSQTIGYSMNLIIPMEDGSPKTNDEHSSDCHLENPKEGAELNVSSPTSRSEYDSLNDDSGLEEFDESFGNPFISSEDHHLPPPHIPRAPTKKMKENYDFMDDDDVDWVETKIIECNEIEFLEEKLGPNGGRGPQRRDVKREPTSPK